MSKAFINQRMQLPHTFPDLNLLPSLLAWHKLNYFFNRGSILIILLFLFLLLSLLLLLLSSAQQSMPKNSLSFSITTLLLQGKISVNCPSLNHLHALYASRLNLSNTRSLAASRFLKMAVKICATTQFFSTLKKNISSFSSSLLYAALRSFLSPSLITGESLRPDLLLITKNSSLYIMELTLRFESNMQINSNRKATKYKALITDLNLTYSDNKFVNLSLRALGILGTSSDSLISLFKDSHLD